MSKSAQEHQERAEEITDAPKPEQTEHIGAILKKEREERGMALETVHETTKIPLDALRAIEEDYKVRTLSEFYYKSFIKIYAKYLDMDVSRIFGDKKSVIRPLKRAKEDQVNFDLLDKINSKLTKERKKQIFVVLAVLVGAWLSVKFIGFLFSLKPKSARPKMETIKSEAKKSTDEGVGAFATDQKAAPQGVTGVISPPMMANESPAVTMTKNVVLTVRAKKESWLRVKVDGVIVFQSTLHAGDVETWNADDQIEITGRNISELEFELNGKMIGSLGRASRSAKGLVVTQEGLSVTK